MSLSIEADLSLGSAWAAAGSDADDTAAISPAAPAGHRPTTWLQRGIGKPKTYSDGTVTWCMLATS